MSKLYPDAEQCIKKETPPCTPEIIKTFTDCPFEKPDKLLPPGMQYIKPPSNYIGPLRTMDWKGFYVKVGPGYSPLFFNELEGIRQKIEACIIVVTGKGGSGKTYFAIRMAEIMDPKFDPDIQIPFGSDELLKLIGENTPLKRGQVIIVDESQWGMSSRDWYKDIQKDIMKQIEAIRSKGYIIFIVSLSIKNLDVIARNYVMTHLIHMKKRGEGVTYRFYMPAFATEPYKTKLGTVKLKLPGYETCEHSTCLRCRFSGLKKTPWMQREKWAEKGFPLCINIRARYERKKKAYLEEMNKQTTEKRKTKGIKKEEALEVLRLNAKTLKFTSKKKVDRTVARLLLETNFPGIPITDNFARSIADEFQYRFPDLMPQK